MTDLITLNRTWLDDHPLPSTGPDHDKDDKGRLLIIGGSKSVPGALLLSAEAAMRVGAGKVKIATVEPAALALGIAFPEAAVIGLPTTAEGEIAAEASEILGRCLERADAVLLGPAMGDGGDTRDLTRRLLRAATSETTLILDAGAVSSAAALAGEIGNSRCTVVLTPHCGEMASLMAIEKAEVEAQQVDVARRAASRFTATVALKSSRTVIATPRGDLLIYSSDCPGLGTAGSGDVLAGVIAGLLARGAGPLDAVAWGVWLHGACGREAGGQLGDIGFMARDLPRHLPTLLRQTSQ